MSRWPENLRALTERVSRLDRDRTVAEVVERLWAIEDELEGFFSPAPGDPDARRRREPLPNGVACFNGMYLQVTEAVGREMPAFENERFLERLDVLFAEFYFQAFEAARAHAWVSKSWAPLFERKDEKCVLPLQFAVAGMNAHINNDLALALVLTWKELGIRPGKDTPEYRDYLKVNELLERVEGEIKGPLADGVIGQIDTFFGSADDVLALWSIRKARADAWARASKMWREPDEESESLLDRLVGFASHLLLGPPRPFP
jgi:hypothetical protein